MTFNTQLHQIYENKNGARLIQTNDNWEWIKKAFTDIVESFLNFKEIEISFERSGNNNVSNVFIFVDGSLVKKLEAPFNLPKVCACEEYAQFDGIGYKTVGGLNPRVVFNFKL